MNRLLRVALLLAFVPALAGCDAIFGPGKGQPTWSRVALDEQVTDAYAAFGFDLFRELRDVAPDSNVFVSPTSAAFALTMAYNGAVGTTADEMARALRVDHIDRQTLNATNRTWLDALRSTGDPAAELAIANSVWHRPAPPMLASFRDLVRTFYDAAVEPITTAAAINAWVSAATRGRIPTIVDGEIPGNVVAYLINAVYFKADWTKPFDPKRTRDATFRRADGSTVPVRMMEQEGAFEMRVDDVMSMLRLTYGSGRFSMVLALPAEGRGTGDIAARLEPAAWRTWMTEFDSVPRLLVQLPRFEIEWSASLVPVLQAMGMGVPFLGGQADFSAMFEGGGPWIGDVLQKTFLKVDEKGTEAAAVTSITMVVSMPPSITFDRPFFLAIYDHATETVLFLGQITDPTA
jgi:serine protease inhibitor